MTGIRRVTITNTSGRSAGTSRLVQVLVTVGMLAVVAFIAYAIWYAVNDPGRGTITNKGHRAGYNSCSGKPVHCTWHPECYKIEYTDGKHDGYDCVSPVVYDRLKVGDYYDGNDGK